MDQPEDPNPKTAKDEGLPLRNSRYLLGDAVNGPQSCDKITAVDPDNFARRKKRAKAIERDRIGRGPENRNENGTVSDVKVGVAGRIALVRPVGSRGHG
jgi:hypothetical protein